ncbi:ankyrin repeat-containing protein ITN1 [Trifolium repens]|nr:ankyrin repeat-containing protein ITN1 [Trifolium repens]
MFRINTTREVIEEKKATASDQINTLNLLFGKNIGVPLSWLLPPGTVIAAAKVIVAIRIATNMQESDLSFIQFFASLTNGLCSSMNTREAVLESLFLTSL